VAGNRPAATRTRQRTGRHRLVRTRRPARRRTERSEGRAMSERWLAGQVDPDAEVRLFCFPHAGGGGSFFLPWARRLAPDVDVCPVVLPGREGRNREEPFDRLAALLPEVVSALLPYADRDVAVLGH